MTWFLIWGILEKDIWDLGGKASLKNYFVKCLRIRMVVSGGGSEKGFNWHGYRIATELWLGQNTVTSEGGEIAG